MDESLKSYLGDFYYRNAYLQAPNRLHNILGADYDNASEAQQQVMNQVYAQLNSLNSNDRQAQRYNRGLDGEVQNWAQGTRMYQKRNPASPDDSGFWDEVLKEIKKDNSKFTTTNHTENRNQEHRYLMMNSPRIPRPNRNGQPTGGAAPIFEEAENAGKNPQDPIIFDLNNDRLLETTDINNGVYFDHENDGFAEASAWVGNNDGILVVDTNSNNDIENGTELLTAETIASFDTNNDGIIDENDTDFNNLKILKGDSTLLTLADAGITSINLNTTQTDIIDENGNQQFATGTFTRADGTTGTFGEFLVNTDTFDSIATEWLDETDEISKMPDIDGSGTVYSLHQAMLRDESGELKNLVQQFLTETNDNVRKQLVEQILIKWTNIGSIQEGSRGENVNAQHLAILEKFMGRNFRSNYDIEHGDENTIPENPSLNAGQMLETAYQQLKINIYAELMSQTHLANLLDNIEIKYDANKILFNFNLDTITTKLQQAIVENPENGKALAVQFVTTLKGLGLDKYSNYFDPFDDNCLYTALTQNDRELKWQFDTIGTIP